MSARQNPGTPIGMRNWIYPEMRKAELLLTARLSLLGAFIAGLYGVIHDQITYSISREYFTKLKFEQFAYADFGFPERILVGEIGFLATWWVGLFIGWFLARWLVPRQSHDAARTNVLKGFLIVASIGLLSGVAAGIYGLLLNPSIDLDGWSQAIDTLGVKDGWAFVRVAYIHNCSYGGALAGLIVAIAAIGLDRSATLTWTKRR